ncbi:hypothetical protein LCGC14_0973700 [marine sediment metagenome]|uniref:NADH:quinone oxidoreductase/Mrp antiporter transmembrane domain-containing protein n=1 Tax=marine sediment metagenome TaxID=412755 RepID=A0A0F9NX06_9ZZZZ
MQLLLVPAVIFLVGSLLIPLFKGPARKIYILLIPIAGFINILLIKPGTIVKYKFLDFTIVPLYADKLSLIVGYIFIIIGFFALLYTLHVKENIHHVLAIWYMGTSLGAVFAGDFLTLYVFWELIALSSTALVFLNKKQDARKAAFRYLIMHLIGGLLLLGGIWLNYLDTGSMLISQFKTANPAFILFVIGVGVNTGFVLLHTWLPDTYPRALFTVSVFMSVYTTKTAVYLLARTVPGWDIIAYMGAAMAVFGVTMALMQNNARKLLSYHIISQVGYMVAAIGIGGAVGVDGGIFHLFNHILYKALLFMTIGAVIYSVGKENLHEMGGLSKKMPITTLAAIVASLSISGAPLFNGFASKSLIFEAAHSSDFIYLMLELAAIGTFLSFLKFTYYGFLRPNKKLEAEAKEVPINMTIAMGGVAVLCVAIGVYPALITKILPFASTHAFYTGKSIFGMFQLITISVIAFALGSKAIFMPHNRLTLDFDLIYIRIINGLAILPNIFSNLNDWFEAKTERIPYYLSLTKKPLASITNFFSDTLFVIWVDMWLFRPAGKLNMKIDKDYDPQLEKNALFKPFYWLINFLDNLSNRMAKAMSFIDTNVVDKTADNVSGFMFGQKEIFSGHKASSFANLFDKIIVDGIVNGVAGVVVFLGDRVRRMQSGLVQNYALIIVFALAFMIFALSIKGGLK